MRITTTLADVVTESASVIIDQSTGNTGVPVIAAVLVRRPSKLRPTLSAAKEACMTRQLAKAARARFAPTDKKRNKGTPAIRERPM